MEFYCGIDLHATNAFLGVIDNKDNIFLKEKVKNDLGAILYMLESFSPRQSVVVEATINWYWLVDGLQEAGFDVKRWQQDNRRSGVQAFISLTFDPGGAFQFDWSHKWVQMDGVPVKFKFEGRLTIPTSFF